MITRHSGQGVDHAERQGKAVVTDWIKWTAVV